MNTTETRSVIVERDIAHPPEKLWRALTQPYLIEEWIGMKGDLKPEVGHNFSFAGEWGSVDCQVVSVEPNLSLAYKWDAFGLESTVTWTLTPTSTGTHLRMEQAGFRTDQEQYFQGASASWPQFITTLEAVVGKLD